MKNFWLDRKLEREWLFSACESYGATVGYPQDDETSLMQWSAGSANLDIFYGTMFHQNEVLQTWSSKNNYMFMHTPVLEGSLTGEIYIGEDKIYTFDGNFDLKSVKESFYRIVASRFNLVTGELDIFWNQEPDEVKIVACYEVPRE